MLMFVYGGENWGIIGLFDKSGARAKIVNKNVLEYGGWVVFPIT